MPINDRFSEDFDLAQKICKELISNNNNAILELYQKFQQMFFLFTKERLYNKDVNQAESVLSNFWIELLSSRAICTYEAKASLKSYLLIILYRRIIDDNRSFQRHNLIKNTLVDEGEILLNEDTLPSPENAVLKRDQKTIMQEALLMLEEASLNDADLIRMHLKGLSYKQMAEKQLCNQYANEYQTMKKVNSIKKQFTRKRTGSLAKFKICLNRCLEKHHLSYEDILF